MFERAIISKIDKGIKKNRIKCPMKNCSENINKKILKRFSKNFSEDQKKEEKNLFFSKISTSPKQESIDEKNFQFKIEKIEQIYLKPFKNQIFQTKLTIEEISELEKVKKLEIKCEICLEFIRIDDLMILNCEHKFCKKCFIKDWEFQLKNPQDLISIKCLNKNCQKEIDYNILKGNLSELDIEKYDKFLLNFFLSKQQKLEKEINQDKEKKIQVKSVISPMNNLPNCNFVNESEINYICPKCNEKIIKPFLSIKDGGEHLMGYYFLCSSKKCVTKIFCGICDNQIIFNNNAIREHTNYEIWKMKK